MIVKKVLLLVGFLAVLLMPALSARAYDAPRIYIKELNLNQTSFKSGGAIDGDFLMWNTTDAIVTDLTYNISLTKDRQVFGEEIFSVSDQIYSNETLKQNFSYNIPKNIPSGEYELMIRLFSKTGMPLNWNEKSIAIKGNDIYLNIFGGAVIQDKNEIEPMVGANFNAEDNFPIIKFNVSNPSAEKIEFKPKVTVYLTQSNMKEMESFFKDGEVLDSKKTKEMSITMPKYQTPGSYLAKVDLFSGNALISNTASFRWVIRGQGAKILKIGSVNDFFQKGKEAKITVDLVGPADGSILENVNLVVAIQNEKMEILASEERAIKISGEPSSEVFSFFLNSDIANPGIEAKIIKDGKELDSYGIAIKSVKNGASASNNLTPPIQPARNNKVLAAIFCAALLLIILIILIALKIIKNKNLFLLAILLVAGLLFGLKDNTNVGNAVEPLDSLTIIWNKPVFDTIYNFGNPITYQGDVDITACVNAVSYLDASVSICDSLKSHCVLTGGSRSIIPIDIAYDAASGVYYVLDRGSSIVKIDAATKVIMGYLGDRGSGIGQFDAPEGFFYDSATDYIYVADRGNDRIVRFNPQNMIGTWQDFGATGSGARQFNSPRGVFYDAGWVYVSESWNNGRVSRFKPVIGAENNIGDWEEYGVPGTGVGQFTGASDIFYSSPYIYVGESSEGVARIIRFKPGLLWLSTWEQIEGDVPSRNIFYDSASDYVYATNGDDRVARFKSADMSSGTPAWEEFGSGLAGFGRGEFYLPRGIIYDNSSGNVYIADEGNYRIVKFNPDDMPWTSNWDEINFTDAIASADFFPYRVNTNIPSSIADFEPGFIFGINGEVYAKVIIDAKDNAGNLYQSSGYERIFIKSNSAPIVSILATNKTSINYCVESFLGINLSWDFADAEDANQTSYKLKIARSDGAIYDPGIKPSNISLVNGSYIQGILPGFLRYDPSGAETYSWEVTVYDSAGAGDGPVFGPDFSFPRHQYPDVNFSPPPPTAFTVNIPIQFCTNNPAGPCAANANKSVCYDNSNNAANCASWIWDFGDQAITPFNPVEDIKENPIHTYTNSGSYDIILKTTDASGNQCSNLDSVGIKTLGASRLKWKEVIPK